jgi:hypothetical protein
VLGYLLPPSPLASRKTSARRKRGSGLVYFAVVDVEIALECENADGHGSS